MQRTIPNPDVLAVRDGLRLYFDHPDKVDDALSMAMAAARVRSRPINVVEPLWLKTNDMAGSLGVEPKTLDGWAEIDTKSIRRAARELGKADPTLYTDVCRGAAEFEAACAQAGVEFAWRGPPFCYVNVTVNGKRRMERRYEPPRAQAWAEETVVHPFEEVAS